MSVQIYQKLLANADGGGCGGGVGASAVLLSPNSVSTLRGSYGKCKGRCLIRVLHLLFPAIFPRASERRVLLIVGVCQTFSHPHIFTSSHLHTFSSSHHIFTSSHLHIFSSSHLHILTSSHSHIFTFSLALLLSFPLLFFFSISLLKARGSANETARNATLSHEMKFDR